MRFRVVTLNLEQDHKRWKARQPLISAEIVALKPDIIAFNEVSVPLQTAKILRDVGRRWRRFKRCDDNAGHRTAGARGRLLDTPCAHVSGGVTASAYVPEQHGTVAGPHFRHRCVTGPARKTAQAA